MRKVIFFSMFPLEYGGGLEKFYRERACELRDAKIGTVSILHPQVFWVRWYTFLLAHLKGENESSLVRETTESIRKSLKGIVWEKYTFSELNRAFQDADVLYVKNELLDWVFLNFLRIPKKTRVVVGVHTPPRYPETSFFNKVRNYLYRSFLYRFALRRADAIHVINRGDEKFLKQLFPKKQVTIGYYPYDFEGFERLPETHTLGLSRIPEKITLLWVGRLTKQKGIQELIELVRKTQEKSPGSYRWIICGSGEHFSEINSLAEQDDTVMFLGHVPNTALGEACRVSDIYISTSKWEGFPYTLLEAQSFGLPVVTFDIPGCQDMIDEGKNGALANTPEEMFQKIERIRRGDFSFVDIRSYIRLKFDRQMLQKVFLNILIRD